MRIHYFTLFLLLLVFFYQCFFIEKNIGFSVFSSYSLAVLRNLHIAFLTIQTINQYIFFININSSYANTSINILNSCEFYDLPKFLNHQKKPPSQYCSNPNFFLFPTQSKSNSIVNTDIKKNKQNSCKYNNSTYLMNQDFFNPDQQPTLGYHPHSTGQPQDTNLDNQFNFGQTTYEAPQLGQHHYSNPLQQGSHSQKVQGLASYYAIDHQSNKKIQQQQQRIMNQLRQKAKKQYTDKQLRKQQGRNTLEKFIKTKQQQLTQRQLHNKDKQLQKLNDLKNQQQNQGWRKVSLNINLKQGETTTKKNTTRMRQSIINKKQDQQSL